MMLLVATESTPAPYHVFGVHKKGLSVRILATESMSAHSGVFCGRDLEKVVRMWLLRGTVCRDFGIGMKGLGRGLIFVKKTMKIGG